MVPATLFGGHHFLSLSRYSLDGLGTTLTLLVSGRGHIPRNGQPGQKCLYLRTAHRCRMLKAVEPDEHSYPIDISLLRAYAVVQIVDAFAQLVENFHGFKRRQRCSAAFHDYLMLYEITVYLSRRQATSCFYCIPSLRVREQVPELCSKTVSRLQS